MTQETAVILEEMRDWGQDDWADALEALEASNAALMEALEDFEGASIVVSHNEYLLNNMANKLIVFDDGKVFLFEGNYQDFLRKIGWKSEENCKKEEKFKKQKIEEKPKPKEKEKLENLIIEKEILLEELLRKEDYKGYGVLIKEVEELTKKLNEMFGNHTL